MPLPRCARQMRAYKISKRFDCDISALCAGFAIALERSDVVKAVRLAFGGMAATVKRAAQAEAALLGKPWTQASVDAAKLALAQDFKPLIGHARERRLPAAGGAEPACSACGWKPAPNDAAAAGSHQRLERDAPRRPRGRARSLT